VFLNAVNPAIFYKKDRQAVRQQLRIDQNAFIVCFVGRRVPVKGALRVAAALKMTKNINAIFIGRGAEIPDCDGVLFCGELPHAKIADYLSASDVFVLPTLAEGCCNAIIEALACGLPVISSDLPFNHDVLDAENAILIDPNNIDKIKNAIVKLKNSPELREKMSRAALETAAKLNIKTRSANILRFMNERFGK
jgi:glycosyltransferase involved in cell wall biosynthesis